MAGFPSATGFVLLAVLNGSSCVGRILPGMAGDRYGHFDVILLMIFGTSIITAALFVPFGSTSVGIMYAFAALWGFGSGSWLSIMPGRCPFQSSPRCVLFSNKTQSASVGHATQKITGDIMVSKLYENDGYTLMLMLGTMSFAVSFAALMAVPIGGELLQATSATASSGLYLATLVMGGICFYMARSLIIGRMLVFRAKI
jgi:hypothetical protein